jgi:hypothetical protein
LSFENALGNRDAVWNCCNLPSLQDGIVVCHSALLLLLLLLLLLGMEQGGLAWVIVWWVGVWVVLTALVEIPTVHAVAPFSETWVSARKYKQRLNQTQYQPRHLPLYQCHYLDEDECRQQDEYQAGIVAERQRLSLSMNNVTVLDHATQRQLQRRRRLLEAPRRGNFKVLVLLIRFADHKNRAVPNRAHFDALFNGDAPNAATKVNTVGSIKEWLRYNSMGRYKGTQRA